MWWFGNDRDDELMAPLERLTFATGGDGAGPRRSLPGLYGYGMAYRLGRKVPLLVIDERRDPRPELWITGAGVFASVVRRRLRKSDLPMPPAAPDQDPPDGGGAAVASSNQSRAGTVSELRALTAARIRMRGLGAVTDPVLRGLAIPIRSADPQTRDLAHEFGLPDETLVSYWPMPTATSSGLRGVKRLPSASAGFHLTAKDRSFLATAGHFGVPPAAPVFLSGRWFGRGKLLGAMSFRLDPRRADPPIAPTPDGRVDLGLIELSSDFLPRHVVQPEQPETVQEFDTYRWQGASSGAMIGEVVGALRMIEVEGLALAHCWFIANDCRPGDSGAAVVHRASGRLLGQVVGARGVSRAGGGRTGTVVQDVRLLLDAATETIGWHLDDLELSVLDDGES
jgi:hypothetical protein